MRVPESASIRYAFASNSDFESICRLLEVAGLPHADLTAAHLDSFLCAKSGNDLVGVIGLEVLEEVALVRSLAVAPSHRGRGIGSSLLERAEADARQRGIEAVYGLTETVEVLLLKHGYRRMDRGEAPESIQSTSEFRRLCPASAALLTKRLAR